MALLLRHSRCKLQSWLMDGGMVVRRLLLRFKRVSFFRAPAGTCDVVTSSIPLIDLYTTYSTIILTKDFVADNVDLVAEQMQNSELSQFSQTFRHRC